MNNNNIFFKQFKWFDLGGYMECKDMFNYITYLLSILVGNDETKR